MLNIVKTFVKTVKTVKTSVKIFKLLTFRHAKPELEPRQFIQNSKFFQHCLDILNFYYFAFYSIGKSAILLVLYHFLSDKSEI